MYTYKHIITYISETKTLPYLVGNSLDVSDGDLRLLGNDSVMNDTDAIGRLEIAYHGVWMTVCGTFFSREAAQVACRQLGYTTLVDVCRNSSWYVSV
jgi:hypothetical protein